MEKKCEQLKTDVLDEIEAIEQVLKDLSCFTKKVNTDKIDTPQKAAIGTFLMNFYIGVENIIKRISKEYYQSMPKGDSWHKELLVLSYHPPQGKNPVFTQDIVDRLNPYRGFRHLFTSGYGFRLRPELMSSLINNIEPLWNDIKKALEEFREKL